MSEVRDDGSKHADVLFLANDVSVSHIHSILVVSSQEYNAENTRVQLAYQFGEDIYISMKPLVKVLK